MAADLLKNYEIITRVYFFWTFGIKLIYNGLYRRLIEFFPISPIGKKYPKWVRWPIDGTKFRA
jgi:hypothetical protein